MSKSKNYNRIVFLTTLSVYLGLVLVGGTAPVLAHSATTKSFDIQTEIEVKDDLDKKPDREKFDDEFPAFVLEFLKEIRETAKSENSSASLIADFHCSGRSQIFREDGTGSHSGINESYARLDRICQKFVDANFLPYSLESADFVDLQNEGHYIYSHKTAQANIRLEKSGLSLKISFSKTNPAQFAEFLNSEFSSSAKTAQNKLLKRVYKNTEIFAENNQVFIITHLPRAAIDEFLAEKDAR